jgi:glycosidase
MHHALRLVHLLQATAVLAYLSAPAEAQGPPKVCKVEPPYWFTGMRDPHMEVLLSGSGLAGLRVDSTDGRLIVGKVSAAESGRYAFVELSVPPATGAGPCRLTLTNPAATSPLEFRLEKKLALQPRFQGIGGDDIIYLVMPDRFAAGGINRVNPAAGANNVRLIPRARHGGNLDGVIEHLDYLQELGVTALLLTPVYQNDSGESYHGYWITDHYSVDNRLGGMDAYTRLLRAAHTAGIKVIQDHVLNHTSDQHPWLAKPPTKSWWNRPANGRLALGAPIAALADPYASQATRRWVLESWFDYNLPDLRQEDSHVERYLIQNSLWWAAMGASAVRLDACPYVPRMCWAGWRRALRDELPRVTAIGEAWDKSAHVVAYFQGGRAGFDGLDTGFDSVFDFPFAFAIRDVLGRDKEMSRLPQVLAQDRLYPDPSRLVTFAGNHDLPRLAEELHQDIARIKLAHAIVLSSRGVPQLYVGDEIGMPGGKDPDCRRDFPGGFQGDKRSVFVRGQRTPPEKELLASWKDWRKARKDHEALRRGHLINLFADKEAWVFLRCTPQERVLVAVSKGLGTRTIRFNRPEELAGVRRLDQLVGDRAQARISDKLEITLSPAGAAAWLATIGGSAEGSRP